MLYETKTPFVRKGEKGHSITYRHLKIFLIRQHDPDHYKVQVSRYSQEKDRMERVRFDAQDRKELDSLPLGRSDLAIESMLEKVCRKLSLEEPDRKTLKGCIQRTLHQENKKAQPYSAPAHITSEQSRDEDRDYFRRMLHNSTRHDE